MSIGLLSIQKLNFLMYVLTEESGDNKIRGGLLELVADDDGGRRSMGVDFGFG